MKTRDLWEGGYQSHTLQDEKICGGTNLRAKKRRQRKSGGYRTWYQQYGLRIRRTGTPRKERYTLSIPDRRATLTCHGRIWFMRSLGSCRNILEAKPKSMMRMLRAWHFQTFRWRVAWKIHSISISPTYAVSSMTVRAIQWKSLFGRPTGNIVAKGHIVSNSACDVKSHKGQQWIWNRADCHYSPPGSSDFYSFIHCSMRHECCLVSVS